MKIKIGYKDAPTHIIIILNVASPFHISWFSSADYQKCISQFWQDLQLCYTGVTWITDENVYVLLQCGCNTLYHIVLFSYTIKWSNLKNKGSKAIAHDFQDGAIVLTSFKFIFKANLKLDSEN